MQQQDNRGESRNRARANTSARWAARAALVRVELREADRTVGSGGRAREVADGEQDSHGVCGEDLVTVWVLGRDRGLQPVSTEGRDDRRLIEGCDDAGLDLSRRHLAGDTEGGITHHVEQDGVLV